MYEDIVTGNVKNNTGDLVIENIYIDDELVDEIPEGKYVIDDRSECRASGDVQDIEFSYENGILGIFGVVKRNTKCTVKLNKYNPLSPILNQVRNEKPNFSNTSCLAGTNNEGHTAGNCGEETNGLYKETTSLGDTYYYRGTVNNNWVKYGTNAAGLPIWWRIIRINEDETIRLIYAGEGTTAPSSDDTGRWMSDSWGINNTAGSFNNSLLSNAYIGYMYGTPDSSSYSAEHENANDSDIKKLVDDWYQKNLSDEGDVLSGSTGFCGDRSITSYSGYGERYTNLGYGNEMTKYVPYDRIFRNHTPDLKCPKSNDLYTAKANRGKGNGALNYPIGLISIDEAAYAGSNVGSGGNYGYWLWTGKSYWTLTPSEYNGITMNLLVDSNGGLNGNSTNNTFGIRPVVNVLTQYFEAEGHDGTINNPYIVLK